MGGNLLEVYHWNSEYIDSTMLLLIHCSKSMVSVTSCTIYFSVTSMILLASFPGGVERHLLTVTVFITFTSCQWWIWSCLSTELCRIVTRQTSSAGTVTNIN